MTGTPEGESDLTHALRRGWALLDMAQYAQAEAWTRRALATHPDDIGLRLVLARSLTGQGHPREALQLLESALAIDVNDAALWMDLGHLRLLTDDRDGALAAVDRVLTLVPDDPAALPGVARILNGCGQMARAQAVAERLLEVDPTPAHMVLLAEILRRPGGDAQRALDLVERVIATDPADLDARTLRGYIHFGNAQFAEAGADALAVLRNDPTSARGKYLAELVARQLEHEHHLEWVHSDPASAGTGSDASEPLGVLAEQALARGAHVEALVLAQANLDRNPDSTRAIECWAHVCLLVDLPLAEVEPLMARYAAAHPDHAGIAFRFGELLAHHRRIADAIGWFERAQELDPSDHLAQHNIDVLRMRM